MTGRSGDPAAEPPPRRLADDLEPGPLRTELGGAPEPAPPAPEPDGTYVARFAFTGRGGEYFRIWAVNLLLTLATLGIYSAWAKVRKTRYFWQNTRLNGHVFDFHGRALPILRGRVVALALLLAYTWSFEFSRTAGLATVALLLAIGPWLFVKAQQFKFGNTSWHGLRFGFVATPRQGYRTVVPVLVLWLSGAVVASFATERAPGFLARRDRPAATAARCARGRRRAPRATLAVGPAPGPRVRV
jgi:uncharacterized membrane protein YjgN (DUF898 family)